MELSLVCVTQVLCVKCDDQFFLVYSLQSGDDRILWSSVVDYFPLFCLSALSTLSGVMGSSLMVYPMALLTAMAIA